MQQKERVEGFFGEYRFLSNFHMIKIKYQGITYPSTEHAYQACKSTDPVVRLEISKLQSPKEARRMGQKLKIRPDFDSVKLKIMEDVNRIKFQDPYLAERLKDTGDAYLEETNYWNDKFWGVCEGEGQNNLGKILMKIRSELIDGNLGDSKEQR